MLTANLLPGNFSLSILVSQVLHYLMKHGTHPAETLTFVNASSPCFCFNSSWKFAPCVYLCSHIFVCTPFGCAYFWWEYNFWFMLTFSQLGCKPRAGFISNIQNKLPGWNRIACALCWLNPSVQLCHEYAFVVFMGRVGDLKPEMLM